MTSARLRFVAWLLVWAVDAHAAPEMLSAISSEPRAFGYSVGDVVSRRITLQVPAGLTLAEASLPRVGGRGRAIELQRVVLHKSFTGVADEVQLDYQVLLAPRELRVLELPALELRFEGSPQPQTLRVDAWPVTVAPLTPADAFTREGLGEMRPDRSPPLIDTAAARGRLMIEAAMGLLLLGYLAQVYVVLPWSAKRRRPFGRAWTVLRALPAQPDATQRRAAFEQIHAALNDTAGEVLFAPGLAGFIARHPRFAPLSDELASFFTHSRAEFFAEATAAIDGRWLIAFCRRCRDIERGLA